MSLLKTVYHGAEKWNVRAMALTGPMPPRIDLLATLPCHVGLSTGRRTTYIDSYANGRETSWGEDTAVNFDSERGVGKGEEIGVWDSWELRGVGARRVGET